MIIIISITVSSLIQPSLQAKDPNDLTRDGNPFLLLDKVANKTNEGSRIQETAFDDTSNNQGQYPSEFKIANTVDAIRTQISPYLQWIMYLGLSGAAIGLIYNGFMLVTSPVGGEDTANVKTRIMNIIKGVVILTGFYVIIKLMLIAIDYILK